MDTKGLEKNLPREVKHFTAENTAENTYGWTWDKVVKEYLRSRHNAVNGTLCIVVMGETYKILRRPEVTVFYDADGDTLFEVTNERLEREYESLMKGDAGDAAGNTDIRDEKDAEDDPELSSPEMSESKEVNTQDSGSAKRQAEEKLKREMAAAKDKSFAEPIIGYLLRRCQEDEGLAQDVAQEHKTWQKCFDYIYSQARKQTKGICAAVRDEVVYEWAEDYYHKDDKAEEEKKAKKAAEDNAKKTATEKAKKVKSATERKTAKAKGNAEKTEKVSVPPKAEAPKESPKPKKSGKEMDGQIDMFTMMEM